MHHGSAWKMPAASYQRDVLPEFEGIAIPKLDCRILAHDPFTIRSVKMDWAAKRVRPLDHGRVEVRVRDCHAFQPAKPLDQRYRRRVKRRYAIPQEIPSFRTNQ